jgi:hypothetical protein
MAYRNKVSRKMAKVHHKKIKKLKAKLREMRKNKKK